MFFGQPNNNFANLKQQREDLLKQQADLEKALVFHKGKIDQLTLEKVNLEGNIKKIKSEQQQKLFELNEKIAQKARMDMLLRKAKETLEKTTKDCIAAKTNWDRFGSEVKGAKKSEHDSQQNLSQEAQTAYIKAKTAQNTAENNYNAIKRDLDKLNAQIITLKKICEKIGNDLKNAQSTLTDIDNELFHHNFEYTTIRDSTLPLTKASIRDLDEEIAKKNKQEQLAHTQAEIAQQQQLAAERAQIEIQKAQLMQQNADLEIEIASLKQMIATDQGEISRIQGETNQVAMEESRCKEELQKIQQQKNNQEQQLHSKEDEKRHFEMEIKIKDEHLKTLEKKAQELSTEYRQAVQRTNEAESKVKSLEGKQKCCKLIILQKENELKQSQISLAALKQQASGFICENHTLKQMAAGVCDKLNGLGPYKVAEARQLVDSMIVVEDRIKNINSVLQAKKNELQSIESELSMVRQETKTTRDKIRKVEGDKRQIESETQIVRKELNYAKTKVQEAMPSLSSIQHKIAEISYAEKQIIFKQQNAQQKMEYFKKQMSTKITEMQSLNKTLENVLLKQRAIQELQNELSEIGSRYNNT